MTPSRKPGGQTWAKLAYEFRERAEKAEAEIEQLHREIDSGAAHQRLLLRERDEAAAVLRKARALLPQLREQLSEFAYQELTSLLDDPFEWEGDK